MTKTKMKKQDIWWAMDPIHDNEVFHQHAIKVLIPFARALSTIIYPVACIDTYRALETSGQRFPLLPIESHALKSLKAIAEKRFAHFSKKAPKDIMGTPIILSNDPEIVPSLRDRVDAISSVTLKHSAVFVAMQGIKSKSAILDGSASASTAILKFARIDKSDLIALALKVAH